MINEKCYIEYLDSKNKFKQTKKKFSNYKQAENWGKKNLENYHPDMIKFEIR